MKERHQANCKEVQQHSIHSNTMCSNFNQSVYMLSITFSIIIGHGIDGETFQTLKDDELKEMFPDKIGPRKKIKALLCKVKVCNKMLSTY